VARESANKSRTRKPTTTNRPHPGASWHPRASDHVRKAVHASLRALPCVERFTPRLRANGHDVVATNVLRAIRSAVANELRYPSSDSDSQFLDRVLKDMLAAMAPGLHKDPVVGSFRRALRRAMSPHIAVAGCPVDAVSASIVDMVVRAYGAASTGSGSTVPVPTIEFWAAESMPHKYPCSHAIGGLTRPRRGPVEISVDFDRCDRDTLLAFPYVLLHELLIHYWAAGTANPDHESQSTTFSEGWMDLVVFRLLERELRSTTSNHLAFTDKQRVLEVTADYRRARHEYAQEHPELFRWLIGERGAANFEQETQRLYGDVRGSEIWIDISLGINASNVGQDQRDKLAQTFEAHLPAPQDPPDIEPRFRRRLQAAVVGYLGSPNPSQFVTMLV
jgi:hypothetical protein